MKILEQLIYVSEGTSENNVQVGKDIAAKAQGFNSEHGISGILIVHKKFFMQCIEGQRTTINQLFQRIAKDPRHKDVLIVRYAPLKKRCFPDWSMRAIEENLESRHHFFSYAADFLYEPQHLSGHAFLEYLQDLSRTQKP